MISSIEESAKEETTKGESEKEEMKKYERMNADEIETELNGYIGIWITKKIEEKIEKAVIEIQSCLNDYEIIQRLPDFVRKISYNIIFLFTG